MCEITKSPFLPNQLKGATFLNCVLNHEIIDVVLTTSGNMTVVIKNLEKNGLVARESNPKDKRSYVVSLTPKGRELIKSIFPKHMKILAKNLNVLSKAEKDNLLATLKKLY